MRLSKASLGLCFSAVLIAVGTPAQAQLADFAVTKGKAVLSKKRPDSDKIVFKAEAGVANIPPSLEAEVVRITFGPFEDTLPAGALERKDSKSKTTWKYKGEKGRLTSLKIQRKDFEYRIKATAKKLDLQEIVGPIAVTFEIGGEVHAWQGVFEVKDTNSKTLLKYPSGKNADADGDGFSRSDGDCDDQDAASAPGLPELCDLADNDCDGEVDEGLSTVVSGDDTGLCRSEIQGCLGGVLTIIQSGVGPQPEVCDDGLDQDCDGSDCTHLQVEIGDPLPGSVTGLTAIDVSGTVAPAATAVTVNGVAATLGSGTFNAVAVPLRDGGNLVTATAVDASGRVTTASVSVILDQSPPSVAITNPPDGAVLNASSIVVVGLVNDLVVGTVNAAQVQVTCNGVAADVANRTFAVTLPLVAGANSIVCGALDQAGNASSNSVQVTVDPNLQERVVIVSGEYQAGVIGAELLEPIVVRVDDENGQPIPNQTVIFRVVQNDGLVSSPGETARSVAVSTDAVGEASVTWRLGSRAGAGLNRVRVIAPGIAGAAVFCASADTGPPGLIVVDAGNRQRGVVAERLPEPLVAVVVDDGSNRLDNVPVTFRIVEGGGSFDGAASTTVTTDSDGRAFVYFRLGSQAGVENHVLEADFPGNQGYPATFTASAFALGDAADTKVSGIVLDNADLPVPGVTVSLENRFLATTTDGAGKFSFEGVLPGHAVLIIDGTTTIRPGVWPDLRFDLELVPGQDNSVQRGPIYLLPINVDEGVFVDGSTGGTLTIEEVPGFTLEIAPGSVTFPDGSTSGVVSATMVHSDKVPMTPAFGQQPRFIITIQPAGAHFDPPAKLTLPNTDGLAPGQITEMYSFDHDLNQFVAIGTGSVSADGSVIVSDPGVGVLKAGWHCGGNPSRSGSAANCPQCYRCVLSTCQPIGAAGCEDGDLCTVGDRCASGSCLSGPARDCNDANDCTVDSCNSGVCFNSNPLEGQPTQCDGCLDGTPCDDGEPCTVGDQCSGGVCSGDPKECDDGDLCTVDSCEAGVGCKNDPDAIDCDDGNDCTDDICFADEGCMHVNTREGTADQCQGCADDTPCSDSDECTEGDKCGGNACVSGPQRDCDDQNECTDDSCDPASGCQNENSRAGQEDQCEGCGDDTPCEDNNLCTDEDKCAGEACVAGSPRDCDDMEDCTEDQCEPDVGCLNEPRDGDCDDEDECTETSMCTDGMCMGEPGVCGDGVFDKGCDEECDGDDDPDCPGRCSDDCRCCDVEIHISEPPMPWYTCVGETLTVNGTVSENITVIVNGVAATIVGGSGTEFEWTAEVPVPKASGAFAIEAFVTDQDCQSTDVVEAVALAVASLKVFPGETVDDGDGDPETSTALLQVAGDSNLIEFASIDATSDPAVEESSLPACWKLFVTGQPEATVFSSLVDRAPARAVPVTAASGDSAKDLSIVFMDASVTELSTQTYGYSKRTLLTEGGFFSDDVYSNEITAKSIKAGQIDEMAIEVLPHGTPARVHVSTRDSVHATVPTSVFAAGGPVALPIQAHVKGATLMDVNIGNESGDLLTDQVRDIRVYNQRFLRVGVRLVVEKNDDVQSVSVGSLGSPFSPCVSPGVNGFLDTEPSGDDEPGFLPLGIFSGSDGTCDTTANNVDQTPPNLYASLAQLQLYLNDTVYDQAVVRWEVLRLADVEVNYDFNLDGFHGSFGSSEGEAVLDAAGPMAGLDRILFIFNETSQAATGTIAGTCAYNQKFCSVYSGALARISCNPENVGAHELGHSLGLRHADKDAANLMHPSCNGAKIKLRALQWDILNK